MTDSDYDLQIKEFEAARDIAAVEAHKEMDCSYVIKWEYLQCWKDGADWGRNYERNWFWNQGHNLLAKDNEIKELKENIAVQINKTYLLDDIIKEQLSQLQSLRESAEELVEALEAYSKDRDQAIRDAAVFGKGEVFIEFPNGTLARQAIKDFRAKFPATNDEVK